MQFAKILTANAERPGGGVDTLLFGCLHVHDNVDLPAGWDGAWQIVRGGFMEFFPIEIVIIHAVFIPAIGAHIDHPPEGGKIDIFRKNRIVRRVL